MSCYVSLKVVRLLNGCRPEEIPIFLPTQSARLQSLALLEEGFLFNFFTEWTSSLSAKLIMKLCFFLPVQFCRFSGVCLWHARFIGSSWRTNYKSLDSTYSYLDCVVENNVQRLMFIDYAATRRHVLGEHPTVRDSQGFGGTGKHDHLFQGN